MRRIHNSPFAGDWYPSDRRELLSLLESNQEVSEQRVCLRQRRAVAFVVPHAAPLYSGVVAASVFRQVAAQGTARVILLGFSHGREHEGVFAPAAIDAIRTPLGDTTIDTDDIPFEHLDEQRLCDHSVEIQVPLLQYAAPHAHLLPLYVGRLNRDERKRAGAALRRIMDQGAVVIASSDLTHYGRAFEYLPFPPGPEAASRLRDMDFSVIDSAASLDSEHFLDCLHQTGSTVCGRNPIALLLEALRPHAPVQELLDYQTSGEITGNWQHSVSYASIGYFEA